MPALKMVLIITVLSSGCTRDDAQVRQKEPNPKTRKDRKQPNPETKKDRKEQKPAHPSSGKNRVGPDHENWPSAVQAAYLKFSNAKLAQLPVAGQGLARLGEPAIPALRKIAMDEQQGNRKRLVASFLMVDIQMFQPRSLDRLARDFELPMAQRAAIQALARIGNAGTEAMLDKLRGTFTAMPTGDKVKKPGAENPLVRFITQARKNATQWKHTPAQLDALDLVMQSDSMPRLRVALGRLGKAAPEGGLLAILRSPASRPMVQASVAFKMVVATPRSPAELRRFCKRGQPQMLRVAAVRQLLTTGRPADRKHLKELGQRKDDPFAPVLRQLMEQAGAKKAAQPK